LLITPLTFLGGAFYPIDRLPEPWHTVSLFNPVVYLVSGFRWSFFGKGDVAIGWSLGFTALFLAICFGLIVAIFRTGYRLKS
jgi:ABC-2 type transport system permease protein